MVGVSPDHSHVTDHFGDDKTRDECRVAGIPIVNGFATPKWSLTNDGFWPDTAYRASCF